MATFVNLEIPLTADEMAASVYETIQERWPDWEPADANLETWLIDVFTRLGEEISTLTATVGEEIFRRFGEVIAGLPPVSGVAAQGNSTWAMKDNAGYLIEAGTEVAIARTGDEVYTFVVVADVEVPNGSTATDAGEVLLEAAEESTDANGLTADPSLISAYDYLENASDAIELTGATSGGVDEETPEDYTDRLVEEFQLLTVRPILPDDFSILARRNAEVKRALTISGWNPPSGTGEERYAGIALIDEDGEDVDAGVKTAVQADLDARREVNFIVEIGAPTYTPIFVTTVVRCYLTYDASDVEAAVLTAIEDYLSPANWGKIPYGDSETSWINTTVVRYQELAAMINNVAGVHYIESLYVDDATAPDAADVVDIALSGTVPLTRPATTGTAIDVTANAGP